MEKVEIEEGRRRGGDGDGKGWEDRRRGGDGKEEGRRWRGEGGRGGDRRGEGEGILAERGGCDVATREMYTTF